MEPGRTNMTTIEDIRTAVDAVYRSRYKEQDVLSGRVLLTPRLLNNHIQKIRALMEICAEWEREHGTGFIADDREGHGALVLQESEPPLGLGEPWDWRHGVAFHADGGYDLRFVMLDDQAQAVAELRAAQADLDATAQRQQRRDAAVRRARSARVPVNEVMEITGLSRSRVYQIRDGRR